MGIRGWSFAAAALWMCAWAPVQTAGAEEVKLIDSVTVAQVTAWLRAEDFTVTEVQTEARQIWLLARQNDGFRMNVLLRVCEETTPPTNCRGVLYQATWTVEADKIAAARAAAESYNRRYFFAKAYLSTDEKSLILEHYLIADGGVPESHFGEALAVFLDMPGMLLDIWNGPDKTKPDAPRGEGGT